MRRLLFTLLILGGLTTCASAQTPAKLSRKERRELAQRLATPGPLAGAALSERDREQSEALFVEGVKYVLLEDYPKALEKLLRAYQFAPTNAAINYKLAEANMLSGNLRDATGYAEAAVRLDPKNTYYYLLLAQVQASQKQYDAATRTYATLVREVPGAGSYLFNLADLYLAQNKLSEALSTLNQAEKQFGAVDEIAFKKQQIYLRQNNLTAAVQEGEKLIQANPSEPRYVLAQAELYANNNRLPDAIRVAEQALKLDPDNPQAHLILAEAYRQQGQAPASAQQLRLAFASPALGIDEQVRILVGYLKQLPSASPAVNETARALAATTISAHPKEAKAYAVAGDVEALTGRRREARNLYLKALRFDNSKFQIWQQVVLIDAELNQADSLLAHTDRALELFPNQATLWFYNGVAQGQRRQPARAVKALEYGRKLATDNAELRTQFDAQLGDAYHSLKDYEKSDAAYEAALLADPENAQAANNYSYFLSLRGQKLDRAKQLIEKLLKRFPGNDTYLDTYAWVLYKQKDYAGARQALEQALKTTTDATVIEHYGDVLWQLQQPDLALTQWQRARKAGTGSEFLERKLKDRKLYE
ncbi:tetratricopeptide repeat protein [uncultured Hymenobacter sp.]|uniref:tetratricopeptide repeat protein n=1 Tax=uncultured Hymenobacter sp. TaxID=170016 RepID=UPI0035CBEA59